MTVLEAELSGSVSVRKVLSIGSSFIGGEWFYSLISRFLP